MAKWYEKKVTERDKKLCREFLRTFGIKCRFTKYSGWAGADETVGIFTECELWEFWSCIFHEMCHVLCGREGKFKTYHKDYDKGYRKNSAKSREINLAIRRTGWNAEQYVDKRAEKLMKVFFPDMPYMRSYRDQVDYEWYKTWLDKNHPIIHPSRTRKGRRLPDGT